MLSWDARFLPRGRKAVAAMKEAGIGFYEKAAQGMDAAVARKCDGT